jgi:hypothetical protein
MQRILTILFAVLALGLVGCGDVEVVTTPGSGDCPQECVKSQVCFKALCCAPNCTNPDGKARLCGGDGCGGVCGLCPPDKECSEKGVCRLPE